jgi:hypothetical protein
MPNLKLFQPSEILSPADGADPALNQFKYRFLAQGDSWFSIGTANQFKNSNLLEKLTFPKACCAVNCARPGATLKRMVDNMQDPNFINLLSGVKREPWHGILLSAGGNDMIDALGHKDITDPALRLFLTPAEITGDLTDCDSYLSAAGWATFETHIRAVFQMLVNLRDKTTTNRNIPIFLHTYHFPTIRDAGEPFGFGPWLFKAVKSFNIPEAIWPTLGLKLFNRFGELLDSIALLHNNLHVYDSANLVTTLTPALPKTKSESGDWINEIHLTKAGYEKISFEWSKDIQFILP